MGQSDSQSFEEMGEIMNQTFLVRHWKGEDSLERVVAEKLLQADNVIEALLCCVPLNQVEDWHLECRIQQYASLTDPNAPLEAADYWEAELLDHPLSAGPELQSGLLN